MTFPTVDAENGGNSVTNETNVTVKLPDGSNVAGKRLFAFFTSDGSGETFTFPSDFPWTELVPEGGTGFTSGVWYRDITGSEGYSATNATITVVVASIEMSAHTTYRITCDLSTPPEASTPTTGTDAAPDAGALNPSGWGTEDTLWLTFCSMNALSSTTPRITAYPANYTNGRSDLSANGNGVTQAVARRNNAVASEDPGAFTAGNAADWRAVTIAIRPVSGLSATVNQVSETDAAQPVIRIKRAAISQVVETDEAQPITQGQMIVPVSQVSETDAAQAITIQKLQAVAQVNEIDSAQAIARQKLGIITQVTEADAAQALVRQKIKTLTQVFEVDQAQTVTRVKIIVLGQTTETDAAQAMAKSKICVVLQVIETDQAQPVNEAGSIVTVIEQVQENDLAQALFPLKRVTVAQVVEIDLAQALTHAKYKLVAQVFESDAAFSIEAGGLLALGIATLATSLVETAALSDGSIWSAALNDQACESAEVDDEPL